MYLKDYDANSLRRLLEVALGQVDELNTALAQKRGEVDAIEAELAAREPAPPPSEPTAPTEDPEG